MTVGTSYPAGHFKVTFKVLLKRQIMKNIDHLIEKKAKELIILRRKLFVIEWIEKFPLNVRKELKEFDIPKSTYYDWRRRYRLEGKEGLERKRPKHAPGSRWGFSFA